MLRRRIYVLLFTLLGVLIISCTKEKLEENSTYSGIFTVSYNGEKEAGPASITFEDNTYNSTGNSDYIPAGGNGSYVKRKDSIYFSDVNFWTANFDWNLILDGSYSYKSEGDSLVMTKRKGENLYLYKLKRNTPNK